MNKTVDKVKLARYKAALPRGSAKNVAVIASVSTKAVYDYLNGIFNSNRIEFAVLQVIKEHKDKLKAAQVAAGMLNSK